MGLIEEFIESEKQKLNWLQKLSANYPNVTETRLLARGYATHEIKPARIIRPSLFRRSLYFLLFLVTFFSWLFLLSGFRGHRDPLGVYLVFVPFLIFTREGLVRKSNLFLFWYFGSQTGIGCRILQGSVVYGNNRDQRICWM